MEYASKTRYTFGLCCAILFDSASGTGALGRALTGPFSVKDNAVNAMNHGRE